MEYRDFTHLFPNSTKVKEVDKMLKSNALIAQLINDLHGSRAAQRMTISIILLNG